MKPAYNSSHSYTLTKSKQYFNSQNTSNIALVVLPTGCGKTGVAVLASYALDARRVLVITPSIIISRQINEAYENFLLNKRVVTSADDMQCVIPSKAVIMKSSEIRNGMQSTLMIVNAHKIGRQSNVRIEDILNDRYDLVIVDEAHHYPAPTWQLLVDHFYNSRRLFLTATPAHHGQPILSILPPCYELKKSEAIARGIIREVAFCETAEGGSDESKRYEVSCDFT